MARRAHRLYRNDYIGGLGGSVYMVKSWQRVSAATAFSDG